MDPPAGIKVTLLPFQQESLYWMKEQEKGQWKGGMLAVSAIIVGLANDRADINMSYFLGRDGVRPAAYKYISVQLSFIRRMGKTIQMIALLASDAGVKPNLVVACVISSPR